MQRCVVVAFGVLLWAGSFEMVRAQAVVYDNGAPDPGFQSHFAYSLTDTVQAEDFTLAAPATVTGLRFHALERVNGYAGSMYWSIRPDAGGRPGTVELAGELTDEVTRTPTGVLRDDYHGAPQSLNAIDFAPVALSPGTYWLVLHNGPLSYTRPDNASGFFLWDSTVGPRGLGGAEDAAPFEGVWGPSSSGPMRERSFSLVGVPEPSAAMVLLAAGVLMLRRTRRCLTREAGISDVPFSGPRFPVPFSGPRQRPVERRQRHPNPEQRQRLPRWIPRARPRAVGGGAVAGGGVGTAPAHGAGDAGGWFETAVTRVVADAF